MTTTFATDAQIDEADTLARSALAAVSQAAVARGAAAVTDYDALRVRAKRQILLDLGGRDITEGMISNTDAMITVEVECTLWLLYQAVGQYTSTQQDLYAARARQSEANYRSNVAAVNPILRQRGTGNSFAWGRG